MKYSHCNLLGMCHEKFYHITVVNSLILFTPIESFMLRLWNGHEFG
jgi:hypothetical protein